MDSIEVDTLTAAQCRMARAGLGLSVTDAAKASLVSRASIVRFENGSDLKSVLRQALRTAFEKRGVVFTQAGVEITNSEAA
jgi:DNA-binding XRE family transcriptional regulator